MSRKAIPLIDFFDSKFSSIVTAQLLNTAEKFLMNGKNDLQIEYLIEFIKKMDWITEQEINDFFYLSLMPFTFQYQFLKYKEDDDFSSSNVIIESLKSRRVIDTDKILNVSNKDEITVDTAYNLIILDDFIGSGKTIISAIKKLNYDGKLNLIIITYLWTQQALANIERFLKTKLNCEYRIIKNEFGLVEKYDSKLPDKILKFVSLINQNEPIDKYKEGFEKTGSMLSINGLSPNNNIPIIWSDRIVIDGIKWVPLLHRKFRQDLIRNYQNEIFKRYKVNLYDSQKDTIKKLDMTLIEFQVLFIIETFKYYNIDLLSNFCGLTRTEFVNIINSLIDKKIVQLSNGLHEIINSEIHDTIKDVEDNIYYRLISILKENYKEINNRFISTHNFNFDPGLP